MIFDFFFVFLRACKVSFKYSEGSYFEDFLKRVLSCSIR